MFRLILLRFSESYFRHRWLYLLPLILMAGGGIAYSIYTPRLYTVQSAVYVQRQSLLSTLTAVNSPGFSWLSASQLTAGEIRDLLQTDSFVRAVIKETDLEADMNGGVEAVNKAFTDVRKSVWIAPAGDNQIHIGANYKNPKVAIQLVNGIFDVYLNWKINSANADTDVAQNFFTNLVPVYKNNLEAIRQQLINYLIQHPEPLRGVRPDVEQVQIDRIQGDLQVAATRYTDALSKLENAKLAASQNVSNIRQSYTMVDAPKLPDKPATSRKIMILNGLVFVVVGLLVSIGAVFGASILDRSFRFPIDVQSRISLPVLAMVPDGTNYQIVIASRKSKVKKQKVNLNERGKTRKLRVGEHVPEEGTLTPHAELNTGDGDTEVNA